VHIATEVVDDDLGALGCVRERVLATDPAPLTTQAFGSTVVFHLSKGPDTVIVPYVLGLSQSAACAAIRTAGLVCDLKGGTVVTNVVIKQSPKQGTVVKRGSKVQITVA